MWTAEEALTLASMWNTEASASEIANMVGKSKNAVIGKAHRDKLPAKRQSPTRRAQAGRAAQTGAALPPTRVRPPTPILQTPPIPGGVRCVDLEPIHCREVIGVGPDHMARFCGADKKAQSSFCPMHHAKNYYTLYR